MVSTVFKIVDEKASIVNENTVKLTSQRTSLVKQQILMLKTKVYWLVNSKYQKKGYTVH